MFGWPEPPALTHDAGRKTEGSGYRRFFRFFFFRFLDAKLPRFSNILRVRFNSAANVSSVGSVVRYSVARILLDNP
jgi:hypothetical protein